MKFLESVAGWSPWLCLARPQELINLYVFCNWSLLTQKRDEFAFPKTVSSFPDASRLLLIGNSALVHTVTFAFPIGLWMLAGYINAGAKSSGLLKQGHISMEISVVCYDVQNSTGGSEWPSRVSFLFGWPGRVSFLFRVCSFVTAVACLTHEDGYLFQFLLSQSGPLWQSTTSRCQHVQKELQLQSHQLCIQIWFLFSFDNVLFSQM